MSSEEGLVRLEDVLEAVGNRIGRLRFHVAAGPDTYGRTCLENEMKRLEELMRCLQSLPRTAPSDGEGWNPNMDEAPRDGTEIDVWIGGEFPGRLTDVSWREPTDSEWWVHGGDTIGTLDAAWHDGFGPLGSGRQPTHWRPLPPHPTSEDSHE